MRLSLKRRRPPLDPVYADARPVLRTYLYVDSDQVLNALSSFQGGRIDEVRRTIVREGGGNISAKVPVWLAQIEAGAQGSRKIEDQIVIKPMFESALTMLLDRLAEKRNIKGSDDLASLREGQLIEVEAFLSVANDETLRDLPATMPDEFPTLWRNWFVALFFPPDPDELRVFQRMRALRLGRRFVAFADADFSSPTSRIALNIDAKYVLVDDRDDFRRGVTVVGQVTGVPRGEEMLEIEEKEHGSVARVVPKPPAGLGPASSPGQEIQQGRAVVDPLCIYR